MTSSVRLAVAQYAADPHSDWPSYSAKVTRWVAEAADASAECLVFPEYAGLEVASWVCPSQPIPEQFVALQEWAERYRTLFRQLASRYQVSIVAGSFPVAATSKRFYNRAYLCTPDGQVQHQDKLLFVRYEKELDCLAPGAAPTPWPTPFGAVGVSVCYDSEFPLIGRHLVAAGAWLLLVPSCTETLAGYHRVRIGCQARALENQCYTVQAVLIGQAPWCDLIDISTGMAGVYGPPDVGMPADGVLVRGTLDQPGWVYADLDPSRLAAVRQAGHVTTYADWDEQLRRLHAAPPDP